MLSSELKIIFDDLTVLTTTSAVPSQPD